MSSLNFPRKSGICNFEANVTKKPRKLAKSKITFLHILSRISSHLK